MYIDALVHPDAYSAAYSDHTYSGLIAEAAADCFRSFHYNGFIINNSQMNKAIFAYGLLSKSGRDMETLYRPRIYLDFETREAHVIQHTDVLDLDDEERIRFPYLLKETTKFWVEQWEGSAEKVDNWGYFTIGFSFPNVLVPEKEGEVNE